MINDFLIDGTLRTVRVFSFEDLLHKILINSKVQLAISHKKRWHVFAYIKIANYKKDQPDNNN